MRQLVLRLFGGRLFRTLWSCVAVGLLLASLADWFLQTPGQAASGDILRTIAVNPGTGCQFTPGVAFDGSELLISCTSTNVISRVAPAKGTNVGSIIIPGIPASEGIGGLSWDAQDGLLWVGTANIIPQKVYSIVLDKSNGTGAATFRFTHTQGGLSDIDGISYDPFDGTIWLSPDQSPTIYHYTQIGGLIGNFSVATQLGSTGATGLAVASQTTLFISNGANGAIFSANKSTAIINPFAAIANANLADSECDSVTFAPRSVLWVKDLTDLVINAVETPMGQCGQVIPTPTASPPAPPTPSPTPIPPTPTVTPMPLPPLSSVDARIEIVFPHDTSGAAQRVERAPLVNVGAFLFAPGSSIPVPCSFPNSVRLSRSLNSDPSRFVALGTPVQAQQGGKTITEWQWDDVDVAAAIDPMNKYYFTLAVDDAPSSTSVWAHGADARTTFPVQDAPTGLGTLGSEVDAKIEIVFPHDAQGTPTSVVDASLANIGVDVFAVGSLQSAPLDADLTVRLFRSLNNDFQREVAIGQKTIVTTGGIAHPRWIFNDVDVSAARDPLNKYYFSVVVDGVVTHSNVWSHGADARTIFAQMDTPSQSCQ